MLVPGPKYNTRSALRKKYQMPTLIIWGMKDKFFANKGIFQNCCKRIAKDKLSTATFSDASHFVQYERYDDVVGAIDKFFAKHDKN